jgi:hypothetical protein
MVPTLAGGGDVIQCKAPLRLPVPVPPPPGEPEQPVNPLAIVMRCKTCHRPYRWRDLVHLKLANEQDKREAA